VEVSSSERLFDGSGAPALSGPAAGDKGQGRVGDGPIQRILATCSGFFEELGFGAAATFKQLLEQVDIAVDTATAEDVNLLAKLYTLRSARASVEVVTKYYSQFLPSTVVNNLRADLFFVLERAEAVVVRFG
jgi:hypothetical protein